MTTTNPTRCSHSVLTYHTGNTTGVLLNTANYPAYLNYTINTWTFDGTNWTLSTGAQPSVRVQAAMGYDQTSTVLFGGHNYSTYLQDTWLWDGTNWTLAAPANNPTARARHTMVGLAGNSSVVLFGGTLQDRGLLNETWIWQTGNWTNMTPSPTSTTNSPPGRLDAAMAATAATVLLFGGKSGDRELNDTWKWDGVSWTQLTPTASPGIRSEHALACDGTNYILFGGKVADRRLNDTWVFNGTTWTKQSPVTSPSVRSGAQMVYHAALGKTVLFGGEDGLGNLNDTWAWDGTNWTQL